MKKNKKVNPYEKKAKRRIHITRKQWIALLSILGVIAILVGIIVMTNLSGGNDHDGHDHDGHSHGDEGTSSTADPHAGHNHGSTPSTGHSHGTTGSTTNTDAKVKYQQYTNSDGTYRLVFRDNGGKTVAEFNELHILKDRSIIPTVIDADKGVVELGWATGNGSNEYECVYYNEKTGQVSPLFVAPRGTDGVRIAYGSEDQTKVIVQDLFDKEAYYKEHALENADTDAKDIIVGGRLQADKKTVLISYVAEKSSENQHTVIKLYE
ncbi:MAG: hypothetical protein IJB36_02585 [Clostridia bacterium]|nr:hypothetical protein [Clostridia bacterium]